MSKTRQTCTALFILIYVFSTMNLMDGIPFGNIYEGTANREGKVLLLPSVKLVRKVRSSKNPLDMLGLYNEIQQNELRYKRLGYQNAFEVMDALDQNVKNGGLVRPV